MIQKQFFHTLNSQLQTRYCLFVSLCCLCYYCLLFSSVVRHNHIEIAKLRSGTLPIEIEKGRYRNTKREERLCKLCTTGVIETEEHFLLHCPAHYREINEFKDNICTMLNLENVQNVSFNLLCNDVRCCKAVAKHIQNLLSIR